MTPGEAAEAAIQRRNDVTAARMERYGLGPQEPNDEFTLARALVDMRAAVHAIHKPDEPHCWNAHHDPALCPCAITPCAACYEPYPCPTWTAVEAVWGGDQ